MTAQESDRAVARACGLIIINRLRDDRNIFHVLIDEDRNLVIGHAVLQLAAFPQHGRDRDFEVGTDHCKYIQGYRARRHVQHF